MKTFNIQFQFEIWISQLIRSIQFMIILAYFDPCMDMRQCFWWVLCEENYRKKWIASVEASTMNVTHKYHTENHTKVTCTLMHLWQASYNARFASSNPRNHPAAYYPVWRWMLNNQNMGRTFYYNSRYESQGQGEKWSSNLNDCSGQQNNKQLATAWEALEIPSY